MKGEVGCIKLERPGDARSLTYHLSKLLAYLFKKTDLQTGICTLEALKKFLSAPQASFTRLRAVDLTEWSSLDFWRSKIATRGCGTDLVNGDNMKRDCKRVGFK